jgi:hypothetical protein
MSKVIRITGLFFAVMLFFLSISAKSYDLILKSDLQNKGTENSGFYFSNPDAVPLFINRQEERLVTSGQNLPVYGSKINLTDLYSNRLSNEIRLLSINSEFLSVSLIADRTLSNCDLVFPFHYFW